MFQFPRFPTYTYLFSIRSMILHHGCSHIRKSADRSLFAAPRSLSQLVTSFVGSQCQGILHMLFFAWTTFCISGDILSVLVFLAWIAVFHTCSLRLFIVFGKIVFLLPFYGKTWFHFADFTLRFMISSFPLLSVMYVTFILKKNQYVISLIRFSMSILFKPNLLLSL